jgi:ATPase family associated with various cellular activities (AAA)
MIKNMAMEPVEETLLRIQADSDKANNKLINPNATGLFTDRPGFYLNEMRFYVGYFNTVPNLISEKEIDSRRAMKWLTDEYKSDIKDLYFDKWKYNNCKKAEYDDVFYFLFDDLMVYFDTNYSAVKFLFKKTDFKKVQAIVNGVKRFKAIKARRKPQISMLIATTKGYELRILDTTKPKLNIELNYNDDFKPIHQTIINRLNRKNDKGLVLLHGKPGTGKTNYIRYLIASLKKQVIFLPPNMANAVTNPELFSILINNPNSILVIEDAENIIIDREKEGQSSVSGLLNISDGLLSDCLNIQIICSFNTDISKVDSALLRKGRLIAKYEFRELEVSKAQALSDRLGFSTSLTTPMNLTEIYNQQEKGFQQQKRRTTIGFKACEAN